MIQTTLLTDYGLDVAFRETTTIRWARPAKRGEAVEFIGENEHLATVGLRVEPGEGVTFGLEVELGSMPYAFFRAVEETVTETLREWRVTDCAVTMTHSGYWAKQSSAHGIFDKSMSSTARDFRLLTPIVLGAALERAGTVTLEPLASFRLECPPDTLAAVLPMLGRLGGVPNGGDEHALEGELPAASVHALQLQLPALTRGEGVLETAFARYAEVRS